MKLVQVPDTVLDAYRALGTEVQAFLTSPEAARLPRTYRLDAVGVDQWSAFGLLVQAHRRLLESFDAADATLGRRKP